MYTLLFEGHTQYLIAAWAMFYFCLTCLSILIFTILTHNRNDAFTLKMEEKEKLYDELVRTIRSKKASRDEIVNAIPSKDYPYFENYLQKKISVVSELDVSAERELAEVSGFLGDLENRIGKTARWNRAVAVRVLSYFRDRQNLPLFRRIQAEDNFPQAVYAASLGVALCKDPGGFRSVGDRLWDITGHNQEVLLSVLSIQGEAIAAVIHDILCEEDLRNDGKAVLVKSGISRQG